MGEEKIQFGDKGNTYVSCSDENCTMFKSVSAVREALSKGKIDAIRIMADGKDGKKGDWKVDLKAKGVEFANNVFGKLVLAVPERVLKPYEEKHGILSTKSKSVV